MSGKFIPRSEAVSEKLDWGSLVWCCRPADTGLQKLVVIEVTLSPGGGHAFHKHDDQEEVIYCLRGEVEQWLGEEKRILRPGDCVAIPAGGVHASFNTSSEDAVLLAIISPAVATESGYAVTELAHESPWRELRK